MDKTFKMGYARSGVVEKVPGASAPVPELMWTNVCSIRHAVDVKGRGTSKKEFVVRITIEIEQFRRKTNIRKGRGFSGTGLTDGNSRTEQKIGSSSRWENREGGDIGVSMPISETIGKCDRICASHYLATLARDHGIFLEIQGSM
jgi:hypothetical protein